MNSNFEFFKCTASGAAAGIIFERDFGAFKLLGGKAILEQQGFCLIRIIRSHGLEKYPLLGSGRLNTCCGLVCRGLELAPRPGLPL